MGTNNSTNTSGDGSRPTTSGGVDNIGAANTFTPGKVPDGTNAAPNPEEKMTRKRQDDDSDTAFQPGPRTSD